MPESRYPLLATLLVLSLGAFLLFSNRNASIARGDEAIHTRVVQEMAFESGSALHPKFFGNLYLNKPPLQFWLSAPLVRSWGDANQNYRIVPMVAGMLTMLVLCFFGKAAFGSVLPGVIAGLIALGGRQVLFDHGMRVATMDSLLLLLVTISSYLIFRWIQRDETIWLFLSAMAVGFACLTKWVAGLLPLVVLGAFLAIDFSHRERLTRDWKRLLCALFLTGAIPMSFVSYHLFLDSTGTIQALRQNITDRLLGAGYHNQTDYWLYARELFVNSGYGSAPLLGFGLLCGYFLIPRPAFLYLSIWALVPLVLYSLLSSRLPWYYLPATPGLWLLAGGAIVEGLKRARRRSLLLFVPIAALLSALIAAPLIENLRRVQAADRLPFDAALDDLRGAPIVSYVGLTPKVEGSLALSRRYLLMLNRLALSARETKFHETADEADGDISIVPFDRFSEVPLSRYKSYLCPPSDFKKVHDRFCLFSRKEIGSLRDVGSYRSFADRTISYGGFERIGGGAASEGRLASPAGNMIFPMDPSFVGAPFSVHVKARLEGGQQNIRLLLNGKELGEIEVRKNAVVRTVRVPAGIVMSGANALTFLGADAQAPLLVSWVSLRPD